MAGSDDYAPNGGASIREVHELLGNVRDEIAGAFRETRSEISATRAEVLKAVQLVAHDADETHERASARVGQLEDRVTRLDEAVSYHMESDGHPGTTSAINSIKVTIAKYAGVAAALGVIATIAGNVAVKHL